MRPSRWPTLLSRMWPIGLGPLSGQHPRRFGRNPAHGNHGYAAVAADGRSAGLLVAGNLTKNRALNFLARVLLVSSRSVNSLVWALLFVAIFGPGPLAGMLAIAFRSVGFAGKLLGEAIEQAPPGPIEALQAAGASTTAQILYGYWPQ